LNASDAIHIVSICWFSYYCCINMFI